MRTFSSPPAPRWFSSRLDLAFQLAGPAVLAVAGLAAGVQLHRAVADVSLPRAASSTPARPGWLARPSRAHGELRHMGVGRFSFPLRKGNRHTPQSPRR
jgi:hypothetical protein